MMTWRKAVRWRESVRQRTALRHLARTSRSSKPATKQIAVAGFCFAQACDWIQFPRAGRIIRMKKRPSSPADEQTANQIIEHETEMEEDGLAEAEAKMPAGHEAINTIDTSKS